VKTDDLIALLSDDLQPAPRGLVLRTLLIGLIAGMILSTGLMLLVLHPRRDLMVAMHGVPFWMKFFYVLAIGALGLALIVAASVQLSAPYADSAVLIMGHSSNVCAFLIVMLALPIFAALLLALRQLAPTRLTLAGASAGLAAGGWAASIYAFHCNESTAPFVVIWYSLGILLSAALGALVGRFALRW